MDPLDLLYAFLQDMPLAAIPAVGFALVFNVPPKALGYCALGGAIGHGFRFLLMNLFDVPIEWATLAAATTVSLIGVYWAQKLRAHPKVFTVAAMIPMVPGVYAFTALISIVEINHTGYTPELLASAITNTLKTFFIVGALAIGLAMPGLLLYRRKPVV